MKPSSPVDRALQERRSLRETALLGAPAPLCDADGAFGPAIMPLAPWHWLMLLGYSNPLFCGGIPGLDDVLQYLWLCSPQFWRLTHDSRGALRLECSRLTAFWRAIRFALFRVRWRRAVSAQVKLLNGSCVRGPSQRVLNAIRANNAQALLDLPKPPPRRASEPDDKSPIRTEDDIDMPHELAFLEVRCRAALGYTGFEFWATPLLHTNQLLSALSYRRTTGPGLPTFDPAVDRRIGDYLRAKKAAQTRRN